LLCQVLEGVDLGHYVPENLVEDVVDPGSTLALCGDVVHKTTLQLSRVLFDKPSDQTQDHWTLAFLVDLEVISIVCQELTFFSLNCSCDLFCEAGDASLNVRNEDLVERFGEVWHSHFVRVSGIHVVAVEKLRFDFDSFTNRNVINNLLLRSALDSKVAQLEGVNFAL